MTDSNSDSNSNKNIDKIGILDPEGKNQNPLTNAEYSDRYRELGAIWSKFPAYADAENIISDIKDHQVTLVVSGTGSGKTVLFPKYVLHSFNYDAKIAITLPKKMIAKSAAEFSAETLDVEVGREVGYQYRGSNKSSKSADSKLLYCTDGTLVARLINDPLLSDFNAVLVDEAHERKVNIDLLLYLLRNVLKERADFKVVIMSATIDKEIFKSYFSDFSFKAVEIGGKTNYPIESIFMDKRPDIKGKKYLEKGAEIIKTLIEKIKSEEESDATGILFFVTSVSETQDLCDIISNYDAESNVCISVYSSMDPMQEKLATDQDYFIQEIGDATSKIKLVIATNVAESSITIEGIKYVIDSGLELSSSYDGVNRVGILEKKLITHAQAKQRMGRTGRTGPGICYHLYTKEDFESNMDRFPIPSIRSESITSEILRLMSMPMVDGVDGLKGVLGDFIEPPDPSTVESDLIYLEKLGMIENSKLTELGAIIPDLQLEPEEGKTMIMAYRLFVTREALAIIMLMNECKHSISNLYTLPLNLLDEDDEDTRGDYKKKVQWLTKKFNKAKSEYDNRYGDLIGLLKIFHKYEELREADRQERTTASRKKLNDWMYENFLKERTLSYAYESYLRMKRRIRPTLSRIQSNTSLIPRVDQDILDINSTFRVLSSFMHGYSENEVEVKNGLATIDYVDKLNEDSTKRVEVDVNSFIDLKKSKSSAKGAIYISLFKFGDRPIKAKIVTYESEKSKEILKAIE
jgi:Mimiviridae putative ATP-dependent RNA helicase